MDIQTLTLLRLIDRHRSLAAVAAQMQVDPSTVSRALATAEAELGLRLFHRSTRQITPTEDGARLLARVEPLVEELAGVLEDARHTRRRPAGHVRVTASVAFGDECLVPLLPVLRRDCPEVSVELILTDARLDLVGEGIDIALRLTPNPVGDLIATRLRDTRYHVCATPDYVAGQGTPETPADLTRRDCLRLGLPDHATTWRFRDDSGAEQSVPVTGAFTLSNPLALRSAARRGLGPALLADWLVAGDLARGDLIDLFPAHRAAAQSFDTGAWLLYPSRSYLPAKTRAVIDVLTANLRGPGVFTKLSPS